jgi:NAD-dependent dihydropyrimidine dehydrogenase PreA subunit
MVMRLRSHAKRFHVDRFYGEGIQSLVARAETCSDCGECESRCPYELAIRETLRDNIAWYHQQMAVYRGR